MYASPIKTISIIANNAGDWADILGLPDDHPARKLKAVMDNWVKKNVDGIVFLLENNTQILMSDIDCIGLEEFESGRRYVYVVTEYGEVHQVMSRKADGSIVPMILEEGEGYSDITIDHVYRMEDILNDFAELFPFLKKLTDLFRKLNKGDIRSTETRNAVMTHIRKNFAKVYANDMEQLIKELELLGKIISLEAMHRKDNQEKH